MRTFTIFKTFLIFTILVFGSAIQTVQAQWNDSLLYVMIPYGGANGYGVIATTDLIGGNYTIEYNFNGTNGKYPNSDLFPASDGFFYGTAKQGGTSDKGVIFKYDTATNTLTKLHDFNGANGSWPYCTLIEAPNGKLYGTTWNGGSGNSGTLFELDITVSPPVFNKKIDFNGTNGRGVTNSLFLTSDGRIFGITPVGGTNQFGNIYGYDPTTNTLTVLHDFNYSDGRNPYGSFLETDDGILYGMTAAGGTNSDGETIDVGTIFSFDLADSSFNSLYTFNSSDGRTPWGDLMLHSNGNIYGMTRQGGSSDNGVIFQFDPQTSMVTKLYNMATGGAKGPLGALFESSNNKLYGLTERGGSSNAGTIFEFTPGTNAFVKKLDFDWVNGGIPQFNTFIGGGPDNDNEDCISDTTNIVAESCDPSQVGVTEQTFTNVAGCDSLVITTTTLIPGDTTNVAATTCDPAQVGVTQQLFENSLGCDSLVITTTTLMPGDTTNVTSTTCDPAQVGVSQQLLSNQFGCDSLVITTTTLIPGDTTNVAATTCDPAEVGVTQQLLSNQFGCDSLVITTTTLLPGDTTNVAATTCDPAQVGATQQLFSNQFGCDSLVITTTILLPSNTTNITAETCDPAQVGITLQVFTNTFGCDSTVITTTTLLPSDTTYLSSTTCDPSEVGVTTQTFTNRFGCDSLVISTTTLDDDPPVISVISGPITLWPPNHKYASFDLDDFVLSVYDNCSTEVYISHATSDEPETGGGSGGTTDDIVISNDCQSIDLRKERAGSGNGRVYTIHFVAEDEAGNTSTASAQVHVPKDNNGTAIDDGPDYEVDGDCDNKAGLLAVNEPLHEYNTISYPNPFSATTTVEFTVEKSSKTTLRVYNSTGHLVRTLFDDFAENGKQYRILFDGNNLPKGIYLYHLQSEQGVSVMKKMILMK